MGNFFHQPRIFSVSAAKLQVFHQMAIVEVWKSRVAKSRHLNHSATITCKEKCYMSERNGCGKVMDVTSFLGALGPPKQRKY